MHTTQELLDAAKTHSSIHSDYRLAKVMDVTEKTVANWRHGRARPDELSAVKLSNLAGLDPMYAIACIQAERATKPEIKTLWLTLAKRLQTPVAVALSAVFALVLLHLGQSQGVDLAYFFPALLVDAKQFTPYTLWQVTSAFLPMAYVANFLRSFPRI